MSSTGKEQVRMLCDNCDEETEYSHTTPWKESLAGVIRHYGCPNSACENEGRVWIQGNGTITHSEGVHREGVYP